jgi:hypothetical protein
MDSDRCDINNNVHFCVLFTHGENTALKILTTNQNRLSKDRIENTHGENTALKILTTNQDYSGNTLIHNTRIQRHFLKHKK